MRSGRTRTSLGKGVMGVAPRNLLPTPHQVPLTPLLCPCQAPDRGVPGGQRCPAAHAEAAAGAGVDREH